MSDELKREHRIVMGMVLTLVLGLVVAVAVTLALSYAFEPGQPDPTSTRSIVKQTLVPVLPSRTPTLPPTATEITPIVVTVTPTFVNTVEIEPTSTPDIPLRPTRIDSKPIPTRQGTFRPIKHLVSLGDNLWDISFKYFGTGTRWPEIWEDNMDVIGDNPHLIFPGQVLTIKNRGG